MADKCYICKSESKVEGKFWANQQLFGVTCPRCGKYQVTEVIASYLLTQLDSIKKIAVLSYSIHKMQKNKEQEFPPLDYDVIEQLLANPLPKPAEQINILVTWLGDNLPGLGESLETSSLIIEAEIGAINLENVNAILNHLATAGVLAANQLHNKFSLTLTVKGWEYYENLRRSDVSSRTAFMAMPFGNPELDKIVENYFRPAVKATGFELYRLDDVPKAGLIDDRLRVEIRTSRFLIADLTDENRGAYWEAGYAEGLGKPVIYTCEKNKFHELKTHFDTNHHTTVLWHKDKLDLAAQELKNTIRATLPEEAKLSDE